MAHHGITFRGKHSDEFNIIVKTVGRPIIPPAKQVDEEVEYRDGNTDYSEAGGRIYYEDKVLELEFNIKAVNTTRLGVTVSRIAAWLSGGYGELIFDDMPLVIWLAKPADLGDLTINLYKNGNTRVQFRCKPFNIFLHDSKGIPHDTPIVLDSDIPLDFGEENVLAFAAGTTTHTLDYMGTAPVRPVIQIQMTKAVSSFSININGVVIIRTNTGSSFTIDCQNGIMPNGLSGDFPELLPGENTIIVTSTGGSGTVTFEYKHNFLYGDGF